MNDAIGYIIIGLVLVIIIILLVNAANSAATSGSNSRGSGRRLYGPYYQHGGQGYKTGVLY